MSDITITYDALQHCLAEKKSKNKNISMDCPYTGKGEEFSPTNLVESALGGCILLSMGTLAMRDKIDLTGVTIDVNISSTDKPVMKFSTIDVLVNIPKELTEIERKKLERAADTCPIKHSFGEDIPINMKFKYPE